MIIKNMPVTERPREKMIRYGQESLSNAELLGLIIGSGTKELTAVGLADKILSMDEKGLAFLCECTVEELMTLPGLGVAKACQLKAAVEIGRRLSTRQPKDKISLTSPEEIASLFMERMRYFKEEHFQVLSLDARGGLISVDEVAIGDVMSISIHPREVFSRAVRKGAVAVVLAHNHPSGDVEPSSEDIDTTKRLMEAGNILGICVLDHIIIGDGRYTSLKRCNLM